MPGGFPAARITDMHTCPMCMGAPFPILPPGAPTVLIGKLPAARMTDLCACLIPALVPIPSVDAIIFGSPTVLIGGLPAARMLDPTVKGGMILPPCMPTVLIGLVGTPTITMPGGLGPITTEVLPDGSTVTKVGDKITIAGDAAFQQAVVNDLATLYATPTGKSLIDSINRSPSGGVTIVPTTGGNAVGGVGPGGYKNADGTNGTGSGSTLSYNPNKTSIGDGSEPWMTRPPAVALGHELVHVEDAQQGGWSDTEKHGGVLDDELEAVGLPPFENHPHTENKIREQMGLPTRPRY
ncbi:MAG: M91 family zinc metallopeptidase [Paracoccaceae bacterium]